MTATAVGRITQIQFAAPRDAGAALLSGVFASLPRAGEFAAWDSQADMDQYVADWPVEDRADVGGYYVPTVPQDASEGLEEGVTMILTPSSGRAVSYWPEGQLWTVEFGPRGSEVAAGLVLAALDEAAPDGPVHVAYVGED